MPQQQNTSQQKRPFKLALFAAGAYLIAGTYALSHSEPATNTISSSNSSLEASFISKLFQQDCLQKEQIELQKQKIHLLYHLVQPWQLDSNAKWQELQEKEKINSIAIESVQQILGLQKNSSHFNENTWHQFQNKYRDQSIENIEPKALVVDLVHLEQYQKHLRQRLMHKQEKKNALKKLCCDSEQKLAEQQQRQQKQAQECQMLLVQQQTLREQLKQLQKRTGVFGPVVTANQESTPVQRLHILAKGESLASLASYYYGTSDRWQEIYDANRNLIAEANDLKVGSTLLIP